MPLTASRRARIRGRRNQAPARATPAASARYSPVSRVICRRPSTAVVANTGPSAGPHLHFGLADKPDGVAGRSLPFVFDSYTLVGSVDEEASTVDHIVITPDRRQIRDAYPLLNRVQNFP